MRENFHLIRRRAKVGKCTLHDLRRSAITNWASQLPIQVVQQVAGRSDIATTRKYYLAVRSEDMVSANKILNNILAKVKADRHKFDTELLVLLILSAFGIDKRRNNLLY